MTLMVSDKAKGGLRGQLLEWAAIPGLKRILVSHGDPIESDSSTVLRELAGTLSA